MEDTILQFLDSFTKPKYAYPVIVLSLFLLLLVALMHRRAIKDDRAPMFSWFLSALASMGVGAAAVLGLVSFLNCKIVSDVGLISGLPAQPANLGAGETTARNQDALDEELNTRVRQEAVNLVTKMDMLMGGVQIQLTPEQAAQAAGVLKMLDQDVVTTAELQAVTKDLMATLSAGQLQIMNRIDLKGTAYMRIGSAAAAGGGGAGGASAATAIPEAMQNPNPFTRADHQSTLQKLKTRLSEISGIPPSTPENGTEDAPAETPEGAATPPEGGTPTGEAAPSEAATEEAGTPEDAAPDSGGEGEAPQGDATAGGDAPAGDADAGAEGSGEDAPDAGGEGSGEDAPDAGGEGAPAEGAPGAESPEKPER